MSKESWQIREWKRTVLPELESFTHKQPITAATETILRLKSQGDSVPAAIYHVIKNEAIGLEAQAASRFSRKPPVSIRSWYPHASSAIRSVEMKLGGEHPVKNAVGYVERTVGVEIPSSEIYELDLEIDQYISLLKEDKTGFSIIDFVCNDPEQIRQAIALPYGQEINKIILLGGERYKSLYRSLPTSE